MMINMIKRNLYQKYADAVEFADIKINPVIIIILTFIGVIIAGLTAFFIDPTLSFLIALLILDLGLGYPFFKAQTKIDLIESRLPDVLHHMGTTLKTGGTVETALKEASRINYGPLTVGLKEMLRQMNEGKTFEEAFSSFSLRSKSLLLQKAAIIIIAARKSGGALLETLSAMAEDFRALYRLERERKTKTFMQFLFIIVSGCLVAPFVFGIVKSVLSILVTVGGETTAETTSMVANFSTLFKVYLILQSALAVIGAVQIRDGKFSKAVLYVPIGVILAYVIYVFISLLGL